jgi:hypothetical protein
VSPARDLEGGLIVGNGPAGVEAWEVERVVNSEESGEDVGRRQRRRDTGRRQRRRDAWRIRRRDVERNEE